MTHFHNMCIIWYELQVKWHNMSNDIVQTINTNDSTNTKPEFIIYKICQI